MKYFMIVTISLFLCSCTLTNTEIEASYYYCEDVGIEYIYFNPFNHLVRCNKESSSKLIDDKMIQNYIESLKK